MATFLTPETHVLELKVTATGADNQTCINRFHYKMTGPTGSAPSLSSAILADFITAWRTNVLPLLSGSYLVMSYAIRNIHGWALTPVGSKRKNIYQYEQALLGDPLLDVGAVAGEALPTFAAVSWSKKTGRVTRKYLGASRLGPISESQVEDNKLTGLVHTAWQTAATAFMNVALQDPLSAQVWTLSVYSLKDFAENQPQGISTFAPLYAVPVEGILVSNVVGTQLSRKIRRQLL